MAFIPQEEPPSRTGKGRPRELSPTRAVVPLTFFKDKEAEKLSQKHNIMEMADAIPQRRQGVRMHPDATSRRNPICQGPPGPFVVKHRLRREPSPEDVDKLFKTDKDVHRKEEVQAKMSHCDGLMDKLSPNRESYRSLNIKHQEKTHNGTDFMGFELRNALPLGAQAKEEVHGRVSFQQKYQMSMFSPPAARGLKRMDTYTTNVPELMHHDDGVDLDQAMRRVYPKPHKKRWEPTQDHEIPGFQGLGKTDVPPHARARRVLSPVLH
jgi:hypothetical protein